MNTIWGLTFILYVFPSDLEQIKTFLKKEELHSFLYGYDTGLVGFKMTWSISKEKTPAQVWSYNEKPESKGPFAGMYCLRVSWPGPQDLSHVIEFKKKYNLGLTQVGITGDWLGEPIWMVYTPDTREKCRKIVISLKEAYEKSETNN